MDGQEESTGSGLDRLAAVDLNLLVPLLAVLEERSVTRAAARVGVSQPAMSRALARARGLLRDDLLVRQGGAATLTPRGQEILGPLRAVLQQAAGVVDFPGFDPANDRRVVTIALTTSTAFVLGGQIGRLMAQRAPHATLRLRTITVPTEATYSDHGVDVVLVSERFSSPYRRERLYDDRVVVVASPDTPPDAGALELITGQRHVVVDTERRVFPYSVLDDRGVEYRVGQLVSDYLLVPFLVARSGGVGLMRHRVAAQMATLVELRIEEFPFPVQPLGVDMVWNPHLSDQYFVAWLRQLLFDAAVRR